MTAQTKQWSMFTPETLLWECRLHRYRKVIQRGNLISQFRFQYHSGHIQQAGSTRSHGVITINLHPAWFQIRQPPSWTTPKRGMYLRKDRIFSVSTIPTEPKINISLKTLHQSKRQSVMIIPWSQSRSRFKGIISFIEPFFRQGSKTVTARVYFDNSTTKIPVGSQVKGRLLHNRMADWLPKSAVVSLGIDKIAFKKLKAVLLPTRLLPRGGRR